MRRGLRKGLACGLAIGVLAGGVSVVRAAGDDAKVCVKESGDTAVEACTRTIKSGRYKGHVLARQYVSRGAERKAKEDYDSALADFAEAVKIDKKYADAYFNRCSIFNFKKDYDQAIAECSQAIRLGPTPDALAASGGERLGKDQTISDYYAERGLAYLKKEDLIHAMADLDNAIRLNPDNGRALKTRGLAYETKGDTAHAEADFAAAKLFGE